MARAYSLDLRERVVAAIEEGLSTHEAAARFSVGISTAGSWTRLKRAQGDVRPGRQGKPKGSMRLPTSSSACLRTSATRLSTSWLTDLPVSVPSGSCGRRSGSSSTGAT